MTLSQEKYPDYLLFLTISQNKQTTTKKPSAPNLENESSFQFFFERDFIAK